MFWWNSVGISKYISNCEYPVCGIFTALVAVVLSKLPSVWLTSINGTPCHAYDSIQISSDPNGFVGTKPM